MYASGAGRPCTPRPVAWWQIVNFLLIYIGYGRTGSDPAVHSTSSVKTYNLKWYQRDQQRRHSTKNREAKGTPPSHCSTEQLIQNSSKVNKKYIYILHTHTPIHLKKSDSKWNPRYYYCSNSSCLRCILLHILYNSDSSY